MGCVLQAGAGMNVARQAAIKAGVPVEVPAETVNRVCGSGLQAVVHAVEAVKVGYVDLVVAGGTESMSNAPYIMRGARWGYRMGNGEADRLHAARGADLRDQGLPHGDDRRGDGQAVQRLARGPGRLCRREPAPRRRPRSTAAFSRQEIVAVEIPQRKGTGGAGSSKDEYPRAGTTAEKLAALKPAFAKDGTVTAGNASGINDGAAALVVSTEEKAQQLGPAAAGADPVVLPRPASTR